MMRGGYFYVGEANGRQFIWAKAPTYECPNAADGWSVGEYLAEGAEPNPLILKVQAAADLLNLDAGKLLSMLRRAHSGGRGQRAEVDGKLTDRCGGCGAKMKRLGFRAWIEEPTPEGALGETESVTRALNHGLGFGPPRRTVRTTWHKTKKEAEAWARHEHKRAKATA